MLSLSGVSAGMAQDYYQKDDYYFRGEGTAEVVAGAERLGKELATYEDFISLVQERIEGTGGDQRGNDRIADDLTFSAPKSVSLLAALGDPGQREEIIKAHQEAVQKVVDYIQERGMVQARDERGEPTKAEGMVAVRFDHFTNRNLEPHLHSHVLVANSVIREVDGKNVSAYLREVYTNKVALGTMYRQELASNLERLGYQVEWRRDGTFELAGFSKEELREFSSRRAEIEKALEERGLEGGKAAEVAALDTREAKPEEINALALKAEWIQKAKAAGIELPIPQTRERDPKKELVEKVDKGMVAEKVVEQQIRTAGFSQDVRLELALTRELARHGYTASIEEVKKLAGEALERVSEKYGGKLSLDMDSVGRERYTFANLAKADRKAEEMGLREGQHGLDETRIREVVEAFDRRMREERGFGLSEIQKEAVVGVATAERDTVIVGRAGAGKTTSMVALKEVYESQGKKVVGVSFTGAAAKNMEVESGIKSYTVDSLAVAAEKRFNGSYRGGLMIVDEAGMVDATRVAAIQEAANKYGMKIVWVGDPDQTKPVSAGDPFSKFVREEAERGRVFEFTEIWRQRDEGYREAVYKMASGDVKGGLKQLEERGWVQEISAKGEAVKEAVKKYLEAREEGKNVFVMADTNKLADRLNSEIRFRLQQEGQVEKEGLKIETKNTEGMRTGEKEFAVGDKVMFLRNDRGLGVMNGEVGEVREINAERKVLLVEVNGEIKKIDTQEYNYLTHGYAMTVNKAQGKTVDVAVYLCEAKRVTENKMYVAASRGREEVLIITNDAEKMYEKLEAEAKVDLAAWTEREGIAVETGGYEAQEDLQTGIKESAAREAWFDMTEKQKLEYLEKKLSPKELEEKLEKGRDEAGEWHPEEMKLDTKEIREALENKLDDIKERFEDRESREEERCEKEQRQEEQQVDKVDPKNWTRYRGEKTKLRRGPDV